MQGDGGKGYKMAEERFQVGELAKAAAGGNERSIRQMLNMAGAELDVDVERPSEQVDAAIVRRLYERRGDESPVGKRLGEYLRDHAQSAIDRGMTGDET
jgi:hypothetical protein